MVGNCWALSDVRRVPLSDELRELADKLGLELRDVQDMAWTIIHSLEMAEHEFE